jgi:hypothetical protein
LPYRTLTNLGWVQAGNDEGLRLLCLKLEAAVVDARTRHNDPHAGWHHTLGILEEGLHELRMEMFKRRPDPARLEEEALQCCAVLLRGILDRITTGGGAR